MGTIAVDKLMKTSTGAAEFILPATDGTSGQVWQTDGSGQLSAGNISGISVAATTLTASGATTLTGAFTSPGIDDNATSTAITIDSSQIVGVKNTSPKSWQSVWQPIQVNTNGSFFGIDTGTTTYAGVGENFYRDDTGYKYISTNGSAGATKYWSTAGKHNFSVSAAGAADAAITWIDALDIEIDGDLAVKAKNIIMSGIGGIGNYLATMGDDTLTTITPTCNRGIIFVGSNSTHFGAGAFRCESGAQEAYILLNSSGTLAFTAGALANGTAGTDGKLNINPASDGKIYFNNRLGGGAGVWYTIVGAMW